MNEIENISIETPIMVDKAPLSIDPPDLFKASSTRLFLSLSSDGTKA
jgi:hypothetical protein